MSNFDELKKYRWSWWGQRAHDGLAISEITGLDLLVCCDWGIDIAEKWGEEKIISLEKKEGRRKNFSNNDLKFVFEGKLKKEIDKKFSRPMNCIMYRSIEGIEREAAGNGNIKIISAPVGLKNRFDNKILFRKWQFKSGIDPMPGEIVEKNAANYSSLKKKWGLPFVLQFPVGSSGENTFLIHSLEDFDRALGSGVIYPLIIYRYLHGFSLNINAVVGNGEVFLSPVSLQVIGSPSLTDRRFGFSGNDFSSASAVSDSVKNRINDITEKTGLYMSKNGFRGMMGLDLICDGSNVYPVEINPRFQNSTSLLTQLELKFRRSPLVLKHIAQFLPVSSGDDFIFDPEGSQVILHNLTGKTIRIKGSLSPGIYKLKKGEPVFLREGYSVNDCRGPGEFALCCAVPFSDSILDPSAPVAKIHFPGRVLKDDLKSLKNRIERTVKKIYNKIIYE